MGASALLDVFKPAEAEWTGSVMALLIGEDVARRVGVAAMSRRASALDANGRVAGGAWDLEDGIARPFLAASPVALTADGHDPHFPHQGEMRSQISGRAICSPLGSKNALTRGASRDPL